jgi:NAD(P)-dependent dehydrogenase (short-subunit alcohol dehydrogenase family)
MSRLTGKVALVTGAASGIGAASAIAMGAEGAGVCCADLDLDGATKTADRIRAAGGDAFALRVDVAEPADDQEMVDQTVARFGALHVAYLNAGTGHTADVLDFPLDQWDRTMAVNLRGTFLGLQASGREMVKAGGGSIVITSSAAGLGGVASASAYSASKHAVIGLAKSAALDLGPVNVRVNAICPGFIASNEAMESMAEGWGLARKIPIGRVGRSEDVANLAVFLASDESAYITGSVFSIDGGSGAGTRVLQRSKPAESAKPGEE